VCPTSPSVAPVFPECHALLGTRGRSSSPSATLGEDWLPRVPDFWHSGKFTSPVVHVSSGRVVTCRIWWVHAYAWSSDPLVTTHILGGSCKNGEDFAQKKKNGEDGQQKPPADTQMIDAWHWHVLARSSGAVCVVHAVVSFSCMHVARHASLSCMHAWCVLRLASVPYIQQRGTIEYATLILEAPVCANLVVSTS
jgi:hypothetical protein